MGFPWAFHWCHMAHTAIAQRALPETHIVADRQPCPDLQAAPALLVYADNGDHIGVEPAQVDGNRRILSESLNLLGLRIHCVVDACRTGESLGIRFGGRLGFLCTTPQRDADLDQALAGLVSGIPVSGDEVRVVIGHVTMRCLLRRPLLAVLNHVYAFIDKMKGQKAVLWDSVRSELRIARGLLVFAQIELRRPLATSAMMYDA